MQLGKALLGAIIGACVGIVLLVVVYLTTGIDKVWLSIPFALIVGAGVRMFASTSGHASYVRGALTMLIALAAYIGGWLLVAQVATARANAPAAKPPGVEAGNTGAQQADAATKDEGGEGKEATDENKDAAPADENKDVETAPKATPPKAASRSADPPMPRTTTPRSVAYTPWDIICLAVAALVAYELGRGSGTVTSSGQSVPAAPAGTHPDA